MNRQDDLSLFAPSGKIKWLLIGQTFSDLTNKRFVNLNGKFQKFQARKRFLSFYFLFIKILNKFRVNEGRLKIRV